MDNLVADFTININEPLQAEFVLGNSQTFDCSFELFAAGTVWGSIDGDISNQTDLQEALNLKADKVDLDADVELINQTINENYNDLSGQIEDLETVVADNYTALENDLTSLSSTVDNNYSELSNRLSNDEQTTSDLIETVADNYTELNGKISTNTGNITSIQNTINSYGDIVSYNATDFATASQGALADTALQSGDNITELVNDAGYITSASLPTVNDGTLTIQVNSTDVGTFSANQSTNETINIPVPDSATWGNITGDIDDQTDLKNALSAKYDASNPDGFISSINGTDVVNALGYTPYNSTNPDGYITSSALSNYVTINSAQTITANKSFHNAELITDNFITLNGTTAYLRGQSGINYYNLMNLNSSGITVGSANQPIKIAGNATRPKYNSSDLALYSDIPTVNDGTLTIQVNGTSVGTFTANQSGNTTANIVVPDSATWGNITGDISDQTDLQVTLDDKQDKLTAGTDLEILNGSPLHNLPSGYTELEYVQSSGTQYLDTGVAVKDGIRVEVDFQYISLRGTAYTFGFNDYLGYLFYVSNGVYTINSSQSINYSASIYNKNHISAIFNLTNNIPTITATIGNETKTFTRSNSGGSPSNLQIFTASGQTSNASTGRCYGVKVYDNDVLVMELVPAIRTSDNKVGMYDTVGNTFKINSGTGNLIASAPAVEQTIINFTNDTGYITGINSTDVTTALGYTPVNPSSLATVATSGDYDDLTNKPTIPTVGDGTITITQGGVTKGTFTTNQSGNSTIALDAGGTGGLANTATGTDSLTILGTPTSADYSVNIGVNSEVTGENGIALGNYALSVDGGIAIGQNATTDGAGISIGYQCDTVGFDSIAIGYGASSTESYAIQIGDGRNTTEHSFQVATYQLLDTSTGLIPDARLSSNIARTSQIPSLTGYATETWVGQQGFITSASLPTMTYTSATETLVFG